MSSKEISTKLVKKYDPNRIADDGYIYTPYITVKGRVIYHPTGGVFKFLAKT